MHLMMSYSQVQERGIGLR